MHNILANEIVAKKIAITRAESGLSQEQLSDIINNTTNIHITPTMVGRYERGESRMDNSTTIAMAIGLDTAVQNLLDGADPRNGEPPAPRKINRLGKFENRIYSEIAANWHGDTKALAIATGCYCALPEEYRLRAILGIMVEISKALSDGAITHAALPDGLPYLEQQIGALSIKANGK